MTTALLRRAAQQAEQRVQWARASRLWSAAVAKYPTPNPSLGSLAALDIAKMRERAGNAGRRFVLTCRDQISGRQSFAPWSPSFPTTERR